MNYYSNRNTRMTEKRLETVGFDARFPNQNQTKNCWQNYVDYFRCVGEKGQDFEPCNQFKKAYIDLCPSKWIEKWDEQREENVFPALRSDYRYAHFPERK